MVVTCPSCQKKYRLEEKHFQGKDRFRFACPSCKQMIEAVKPASGAAPPATEPIPISVVQQAVAQAPQRPAPQARPQAAPPQPPKPAPPPGFNPAQPAARPAPPPGFTPAQPPAKTPAPLPPQDSQAGQPATQKIRRGDETGQPRELGADEEAMHMPEGKRVSLAVLQGADAGQIFVIEKPVFTIGRAEADAILGDSEVSRHHAQIELKGNAVFLRDLKSTNGTYVNEQRITLSPVENQTEFRVGTTTLMLIVTEEIL